MEDFLLKLFVAHSIMDGLHLIIDMNFIFMLSTKCLMILFQLHVRSCNFIK
ncbi:hypothetical protein Scep_007867 [Stephania cephalantha]|uniref:Uncharacterized protein n=1 Tax=Stephania cephalantha TaxID=152367 RepID=A0AAP0PP62_9MAGN